MGDQNKKFWRKSLVMDTMSERIKKQQAKYSSMSKTFFYNELKRTIILNKFGGLCGFTLQSHTCKNHRTNRSEALTCVFEVEANGRAYKAGMRKGDILHSINDTTVKGVKHESVVQLINQSPNPLRLVVVCGDWVQRVELKVKRAKLEQCLIMKRRELEKIEKEEQDLLKLYEKKVEDKALMIIPANSTPSYSTSSLSSQSSVTSVKKSVTLREDCSNDRVSLQDSVASCEYSFDIKEIVNNVLNGENSKAIINSINKSPKSSTKIPFSYDTFNHVSHNPQEKLEKPPYNLHITSKSSPYRHSFTRFKPLPSLTSSFSGNILNDSENWIEKEQTRIKCLPQVVMSSDDFFQCQSLPSVAKKKHIFKQQQLKEIVNENSQKILNTTFNGKYSNLAYGCKSNNSDKIKKSNTNASTFDRKVTSSSYYSAQNRRQTENSKSLTIKSNSCKPILTSPQKNLLSFLKRLSSYNSSDRVIKTDSNNKNKKIKSNSNTCWYLEDFLPSNKTTLFDDDDDVFKCLNQINATSDDFSNSNNVCDSSRKSNNDSSINVSNIENENFYPTCIKTSVEPLQPSTTSSTVTSPSVETLKNVKLSFDNFKKSSSVASSLSFSSFGCPAFSQSFSSENALPSSSTSPILSYQEDNTKIPLRKLIEAFKNKRNSLSIKDTDLIHLKDGFLGKKGGHHEDGGVCSEIDASTNDTRLTSKDSSTMVDEGIKLLSIRPKVIDYNNHDFNNNNKSYSDSNTCYDTDSSKTDTNDDDDEDKEEEDNVSKFYFTAEMAQIDIDKDGNINSYFCH